MSVIINILIFLAIFGYALYTLVKFFKRSKQGKCGTCDILIVIVVEQNNTQRIIFLGNNLKNEHRRGRPDAHFLIRYMLNCRYLPFTTNSLSSTSISTCLTSV